MITRADIRQLETLLSQLADEGSSQSLVGELEQILLDNPELQDHYWQWMDTHVLLGIECQTLLGASVSADSSQLLVPSNGFAEPVSDRRSSRRRWGIGAATAAGLIGLLAAAPLWRGAGPDGASAHAVVAEKPPAAAEPSEMWRIPQVTHVKWTGPYFANSIENDLVAAEVRPGRVALQLSTGATVNAYLLELKPGETADVVITADARSENNFSITELDARGMPIRRSVSFNNYIRDGSGYLRTTRQYGLLGTWSASNDSAMPKYYLLTGIHQVVDPDSLSDMDDLRWRISDMKVVIDEPDVVLLGCDDGGIESYVRPHSVPADGDYDDISVMLHIESRSRDERRPLGGLRVVGAALESVGTPRTEPSEMHRFRLAPGELVVLGVTTAAALENCVFLANEETGEILWSATRGTGLSANLGGVLLENRGDVELQLALFGEHRTSILPAGNGSTWESSAIKVCNEQQGCVVIGMEDSYGSGIDEDFDDIRVTIFDASGGRDAPIGEMTN
ncbi:MAG: hypothetical protein KDA44_17875 [Planctomycetales bacterium]|nr:hypothetical protein [Planctomycetales bacterium]